MSTKGTKVWRSLRTAVMVTVISGLLWLMAESQMVNSQVLTVRVVLMESDAQDGSFVVRPAAGVIWEGTIEVTLEGATSELDRAMRQLGGTIELVVGEQIPETPGRHDLDMKSIWRKHPVIRQNGVRISEVVPEVLVVEVDRLVELSVPVRVEIPTGVELQGPGQSVPEQLTLLTPSMVAAKMQGVGLEAIVRVDSDAIAQLTPGRSETIRGMPVELSEPVLDEWSTTIGPGRVDVRILLRSLIETLELPPMPVQVLMAPDEVGRYEVVIAPADRDVVSVMVSGPGEAIEKIRSNGVVPAAFLALTLDQLVSRVTSAQIDLHGLPEGVKMVGAPKMVQLTIRAVGEVDPGDDPEPTP
ncbi:MAG: hypothetical protein JKY96_00915 [Phycisphaerales bacterium]|nr:hypothetical protein [Phycisphaerales bacterium]